MPNSRGRKGLIRIGGVSAGKGKSLSISLSKSHRSMDSTERPTNTHFSRIIWNCLSLVNLTLQNKQVLSRRHLSEEDMLTSGDITGINSLTSPRICKFFQVETYFGEVAKTP